MKSFVLIVKVNGVDTAMVTKTPDISKALKKFKTRLIKDNSDKGGYFPEIQSVKLVPVIFKDKEE